MRFTQAYPMKRVSDVLQTRPNVITNHKPEFEKKKCAKIIRGLIILKTITHLVV